MSEKKPTQKPLVIRIREAKNKIIAAVNSAVEEQNLPYYLIEPIIAEMHGQITSMAAQEYEQAKHQLAAEEAAGDDDSGSGA
jgi:hypothetical protein